MKNVYEYLNDVKMDFSIYQEEILNENEVMNMKNAVKKTNKINFKKIGTIAACAAVLGALTLTAPAKEFIGNIIKTVTTGHNEFVQVDPDRLPDMYYGLIFDENGNKVSYFYPETEDYYDKNGKKIEDIYAFLRAEYEKLAEENGWDIKVSTAEESSDPLIRAENNGSNVVKNIEEINNGLNFEAKLPGILPDDFSFYFATADGDYLFLYYTNSNGEYFTVHERVINEDTAYSAGAEKIEETEINGNKAVIMDNSSVDWECDGLSYSILGRDILNRDELLEVAKSIK